LEQAGKSQGVASKTTKNRSWAEVKSNHVNEQKNAIETKGHLVTKMTLRTLIFPNSTEGGHPFLAE
jgi:hypothetical protein